MTYSSSARPLHSMWGKVQHAEQLLPGIWSVGTAGHGGFILSAQRNDAVPAYMRQRGAQYEEDCDWCLPVIAFEDEFLQGGQDRLVEAARRTFIDWHPCAYEKHFGRRPTAEESREVRRAEVIALVTGKWVVRSASGDWAAWVPGGMVGVSASLCLDTLGNHGSQTRWFLVDAARYRQASRPAVIDDLDAREIPDPFENSCRSTKDESTSCALLAKSSTGG